MQNLKIWNYLSLPWVGFTLAFFIVFFFLAFSSEIDNLYLSNNYFVGEIPNQICDLNLIWDFEIEDGEYTSKDPSDISNNTFCPSYPDCGDGEITSTNEQDTSNCTN